MPEQGGTRLQADTITRENHTYPNLYQLELDLAGFVMSNPSQPIARQLTKVT